MTRKHHFFNYLKNEYESSSLAPPRRGLPRSLSQAPSSPVPPYFASLAPRAPQLRPASIHLPPPQVPSDSRQSPDMSRNTSGLHTVSLKKTVGVSTGTSSKGLRRVLHSGKQEQRGAGQGQEGFGRSFHVASGVKRRKETGQLQMLTTTSFALKPKPDIQSSTIRQNLALTRNISIDGIMATKPRINMSKRAPSFFG
jgi:hypothetical protein